MCGEYNLVMTELEAVPTKAVAKLKASDMLARFTERAAATLVDLMDSDNDRVRLAAAEAILDRMGLGKTQTVDVAISQSEHDVAKHEAETLLAQLELNRLALPVPKPSLEAVILHESDSEELATCDPIPTAIETMASDN